MRLNRQEVLTRETYVSKILRENRGLSVRAIQRLVIAKFGKQMRPARILKIRRGVLTGNHSLETNPPSVVSNATRG